jgi:hypothetical protein
MTNSVRFPEEGVTPTPSLSVWWSPRYAAVWLMRFGPRCTHQRGARAYDHALLTTTGSSGVAMAVGWYQRAGRGRESTAGGLHPFLKTATDRRGAATVMTWRSGLALTARLTSFLIMCSLHWLYHPTQGGHSGSEGHG